MPPVLGNSRPRGRGRLPTGPLPGQPFPKKPGIAPPRGPGGQLPGNGGTAAPGRGARGRGQQPERGVGANGKGQGATKGKGVGVSGAALPGPGGRQLQARVASGAITEEQAQRTMQQRQTLKKALGPDWREKLQVGGKSFGDVNKGLKANPGDATLAALRKKLLENRKSVLAAAQSKGKGKAKGKGPSGEGGE